MRFGDLGAILGWLSSNIATQKKGLTHLRLAHCDAEGPGPVTGHWHLAARTDSVTFGHTPHLVQWPFYELCK
jgi:hypothetical protein